MDLLSIEKPEIIARATDNIPEMAKLIEGLAQKGIAYRADDGSYYFRIARFPGYGKLSKKDLAHMEDGARVDSDRFDKEEIRDFALWKAPKPGEAKWQTEIGCVISRTAAQLPPAVGIAVAARPQRRHAAPRARNAVSYDGGA